MVNQIDRSKWLLQQPRDSGYTSDENDPFAQAFNTHQPLSVIERQDSVAPSLCRSSMSVASEDSPFQYADSLSIPSEQWQPYDSASYSTFMFNGGMDTMPGFYDNYESMLSTCQPTYDTQSYTQSQPQQQQQQQQEQQRQEICLSQQQVSQPQSASLLSLNSQSVIQDSDSPRGRANQRLPHTAVEQRYRQNLNVQFGKLRQAVPDIQTSQPQRGGNPPKPSKCEVLMGACDYIKQLEEENRRLKEAMDGSSNGQRKRTRID